MHSQTKAKYAGVWYGKLTDFIAYTYRKPVNDKDTEHTNRSHIPDGQARVRAIDDTREGYGGFSLAYALETGTVWEVP